MIPAQMETREEAEQVNLSLFEFLLRSRGIYRSHVPAKNKASWSSSGGLASLMPQRRDKPMELLMGQQMEEPMQELTQQPMEEPKQEPMEEPLQSSDGCSTTMRPHCGRR